VITVPRLTVLAIFETLHCSMMGHSKCEGLLLGQAKRDSFIARFGGQGHLKL
jgi:hypothetical protein